MDIGEAEQQSDGREYSSSNLYQAIDQNILKFPELATIDNHNTSKKFSYVFVADEAFALKAFLVRRYLGQFTSLYSTTDFFVLEG